MVVCELMNHPKFQHLMQIDASTRITVSSDLVEKARIYFERLTEDQAKLTIGKYCSIALEVSFYLGGNHNMNRISTWIPDPDMECDHSRDLLTKGDITVGNDVWIGRGAAIMSGVTIGTGSVIGCYSVVSKDIEPYSIVVGNPGRVIKKRFTDDKIALLLKSEWWNWDFRKIKSNSHIIFGESFKDFEKLVNQQQVA